MTSFIRKMVHGREEPIYMPSSGSQLYANHYPPPQNGALPALELKVPMCCEKCVEKVKEELEELNGVRSVICDSFNQRVTIIGNVDPLLALKQLKKAKVGGKCELISSGSYIINNGVSSAAPPGLVRSNSFGRSLGRLPSFGSSTRQDPRRHDFSRRDDDERQRYDYRDLNRDSQRDFYGVRRMPSFNRHRYHDAEYMSMDSQYASPYGESLYSSHHSQQPIYQSQVSFSQLPVTNPYYMKHIPSEY